MIASEYSAGEMGTSTVPTIFRRWLIPYAVGRRFFHSLDDLPKVARILGGICLILSVYGAFEMVTKINPVVVAMKQTFGLLEQGQGFRMGLKRAQGLCSHPIFFGLTMVLLLPWALEAVRRRDGLRVSLGRRLIPWITAAAVTTALSRGPILAALSAFVCVVFFRVPRLRAPIASLAVIALIALTVGKDVIMTALADVVDDAEASVPLVINGRIESYNGTTHRVLQFKAYGDAIEKTGFFGYGSTLKAVRSGYEIHPLLWSIDCHYLFHLLQYGYVGVVLFLLLAVRVLQRLATMALDRHAPASFLAAGLFGALAAVNVSLLSVFFSYDFRRFWLFYSGLTENLYDLATQPGGETGGASSEVAELEYDSYEREFEPQRIYRPIY